MRTNALWILPFTATLLFGCPKEDDGPVGEAPVINSFTASENVVASGDNVVLTWDVANATMVNIDAAPGGSLVVGSVLASDTKETRPITADTVFTLTAIGAGGKTATKMLTVTVDLNRVAITAFDAVPNPTPLGHGTHLSWDTLGATRVKIQLDDVDIYTAQPSEISHGEFATQPITTAQATFTIIASNDTDMRTDEVTVETIAPPTISSFTASPSTFTTPSADVTLTFATQNAMELKLYANDVAVAGFDPDDLSAGTYMTTVMVTTTFELLATNIGGETRKIAIVATVQNEMEPNDDFDVANVLTTGGVVGTIGMADIDWFEITVPDGGNVFAETSDGMGGCAFDTILRLYDVDAIELGSNDDKGGNGMGMGMGIGKCSRIDPVADRFAGDLLGGTYFLSVEGKDAATGPYALVVVIGTAECGNGIVEGDELCDDGNHASGDGCDPQCAIEVSGTVMGTGGTVSVSLGPQGLGIVEVVLARAGQSIEAVAHDSMGGCTQEANLLLRNSTRELIGYAQSDAEVMECATFAFPDNQGNIDLAAGTYTLDIENATDLPATLQIVVTIHDAACGNTAVEPSQNEQCDDGNTMTGDGCDAMCHWEPLGSISGPPGEMTFTGAIDPGDQLDLYRVTLTAPGYIIAETFLPTLDTCTSTTSDTVIEVYDDLLIDLLASNDDIMSGVPCSRLAPDARDDLLPAGDYWFVVRSFSDEVIPSYALRLQLAGIACGNGIIEPNETCDDGNLMSGDGCSAMCSYEGLLVNEVEPNNMPDNTATPSGATPMQPALVTGAIDPLGDVDLYSVEVTAMGQFIRVVTHTSPNDQAVCLGADTEIALLDSTGALIASDDDDGEGVCSLIDPLVDEPMTGLAPGRYYVRVHRYGDTTTLPLYFATISIE